jgi:hypothetical protein
MARGAEECCRDSGGRVAIASEVDLTPREQEKEHWSPSEGPTTPRRQLSPGGDTLVGKGVNVALGLVRHVVLGCALGVEF